MLKHSGIPFRAVLLLVASTFWMAMISAIGYGAAPAAPTGEVKADDGLLVVTSFEPLALLLLGAVLLLLAFGIKSSLSRKVKILRNSILKN